MKKMTVKQISYAQAILEKLLAFAERENIPAMEKDIKILADMLNRTAFDVSVELAVDGLPKEQGG